MKTALATFLLMLVCVPTANAARRSQGTRAGIVYTTPTKLYYRDPIQTPRWHKGYDVKIRTQTVTLPNNGGSLLLNRYYSE